MEKLMKDQIVSFKTAKLAKEKGFKGVCYYYYDNKVLKYTTGISQVSTKDTYLAPTQSLLQKWLREIHKIHIEITVHDFSDGYIWGSETVFSIDKNHMHSQYDGEFKTYEEALESGIVHALNNIK